MGLLDGDVSTYYILLLLLHHDALGQRHRLSWERTRADSAAPPYRNLTEQIPPSANYHTFSFIAGHYSQTLKTTCTGTAELGITCDDSAFQVGVDLGITSEYTYSRNPPNHLRA